MSWDNSLGVMSDGLWNEIGDQSLRILSLGMLGEVTAAVIPVPPTQNPTGGSGGGLMADYWLQHLMLEDLKRKKRKRR